jgi:NTE family protein
MVTSKSSGRLRTIPTMTKAAWIGLALIALDCAHRPPTPRIEWVEAPGYRMAEASRPGQSDDLLPVLAFSGGGMRAAAMGYGVLEELRRTEVTIDGKKRRLLDEVDVISAISGGTLPAVYYGLRGEATFDEFDAKVLSRDLEMALVRRILTPTNWFRLPSSDFNRSDLFAEIYDETVFGGATFGDLKAARGPFVLVHGTDVTTGARRGHFDGPATDAAPHHLREPHGELQLPRPGLAGRRRKSGCWGRHAGAGFAAGPGTPGLRRSKPPLHSSF